MTVTMPRAIAEMREIVDPALRRAVDELAPMIRRVCTYHFGWTDENGNALAGKPGKAIRPALAIMAARAVGGEHDRAVHDRAVPAAVAVELVHNFSLLHDDVMDRDERRRGRATAWTVFGIPAAILAGDALLTLAVEVVRKHCAPTVSGEVLGCLDDAVQRLIAGQAIDCDFEQRNDVTLDECLDMAAAKTGALMKCATAIGAIAVGASESDVRALAEFGDNVGLAFQLVDDLLGIWGAPEATGKPALADLRSKKKSVPVVAALTSGTQEGRELAELYRRAQPLTDDELPGVAKLVERAGGLLWTEQEADRRIRLARKNLDSLDLSEEIVQPLWSTALFVTGRDR